MSNNSQNTKTKKAACELLLFWEILNVLFSELLLKMGKTLKGGAREVIYNVFKRCLAEYHAGKLLTELDDLYIRVADMPGKKSESCVRSIINESNKNDGKFTTPAKQNVKILDHTL
ncbi:hypothetical protein PYW07_004903 [Mythimna separata]|uniref:Uncharacterized protein n=1 Tax=Mythimna separata TaxID=271217 RepID=A0AAD7YDW9_MYTSE|nr:hypothetical protein PYW07_004903 [Mythimna separata]